MSPKFFADVIVPVAVPALFTYIIPENLISEVEVGKRVVVQFGKQKIYSALVRRIHDKPPSSYEIKEVLSVLDEHPVISERHFKFWEWLASYYMCTLGEVMNTALPAAFRLQSESKIMLNPEVQIHHNELGDKEFLLVQALEMQKVLSMKDVSKILHLKAPHRIIKSLSDKDIIIVEEEIHEKVKPLKVKMLRLAKEFSDDEIKNIFLSLEKKSPAQSQMLMTFISLSQKEKGEAVSKQDLLQSAGKSSAAITALIKKNILEEFEENKNAMEEPEGAVIPVTILNETQQTAFQNIKQQFQNHDTVLLHGVTSSGKTEIYIHFIEEMIKSGKQVLYLLPEIALSTQIINRLKKHFGFF